MNSKLLFTKMQGAGNDFVLFDNRKNLINEEKLSELAPIICNRKFGVGSDGIIALKFDPTNNADLVMLYKNPDGSDAGMCGNGARCFAAYAVTMGSPSEFTFRVHDQIYKAVVQEELVSIHFPLETTVHEILLDGEPILKIYTNTEHVVCPETARKLKNKTKLVKRGQRIRYHDIFSPIGTNVNFMSGYDSTTLKLQTYERGVENLTLACGTGAIASALAWHHLQQEKSGDFSFNIETEGGTLTVHFTFKSKNKIYSNIRLEGPAKFVFTGEYFF